MNVNSALNAASSPQFLEQYVGIQMLDKAQNLQINQAAMQLQDFAKAQSEVAQAAAHPYLGGSLDILA